MEIKATNVFHRNYKSKKRYVINRGGTRSSKTFSLAQICVLWLYTGKISEDAEYQDKGIFSVVRKHSTTLKTTAMRDVEEVIDMRGIRGSLDINKTEKTFKKGNRVLEFFGADNQQKIRGTKRDWLYCNEANELSYDTEFYQLKIRTTGKIFIDFNPDDEDIWINTEIEQKASSVVGGVDVIVSTYKDNPFLPDIQVKEIENLMKTNLQYWRVYGLGEYGKLEGIIFNKPTIISSVPSEAKLLGYGKDFGYTNDPTTLIAVYKYNGELIIDEEIYQTGLLNSDIIKLYKNIGVSSRSSIFGDSADPKSIEEIRRSGYNIKPVTKGADSIRFGINIMKQYKINVTERSVNTIKEFRKYSWEIDKNGKTTNKPIDMHNHCIDAIRYLCMMKLKKNKIWF